ncbi:MAG: GerMN domain-containing protein [Clostridiales bacterium]|nr:GerMN domain-containing protein [Clostridiales bacterium]
MLKVFKKSILFLLVVGILCSCFGCNMFITIYEEDTQANDLPQMHPDDGIKQSVTQTLYYKLMNTSYLVPVEKEIEITVNEPIFEALLRYLSKASDTVSAYSSAFPTDVRIIDVSQSGNIIYVTLNQDFMQNEHYLEGEYSKSQIINSIVNTITKYNSQVSVQILVDSNGDGVGERLSYSALNLNPSQSLVEPLVFNSDMVADAGKILGQAFNSLAKKEYEKALLLFTATDTKIDENNLRILFGIEYKLKDFEVKRTILTYGSETAYVEINASFEHSSPNGERIILLQGIKVPMNLSDGIYKVSFEDLVRIIEEAP